MKMRYQMTSFLLLILIFFPGCGFFSVAEAATPTPMSNYCSTPPFLNTNIPPLVMLVVSKDHKMYFKAYDDVVNLDGTTLDSNGMLVPNVTYTDTINYYGYFDSNKCYNYSSSNNRYEPSALATGANNHYCSGNWSGNFLNWATMARIDVFRKVLYGGKRDIDTSGTTVLSRTTLTQDSHSWAKVYTGSDIASLTPASTGQTAITICNTNTCDASGNCSSPRTTTCNSNNNCANPFTSNPGSQGNWSLMTVSWGSASNGPATPSNTNGGYYPYAAALDGGVQCSKKYNTGPNVGPTLPIDTWMYVNVKVCDSSSAAGLESDCLQYGSSSPYSYKPAGLMQTMGLDPVNNAPQMYFGLITGSYNQNKSGGLLRSNFRDVTQEINTSDGTINTGSSKIIKTLDMFRLIDYNFPSNSWVNSGQTYNCPLSATFSEGQCRNWGNPMSEMYYEALRYIMGESGPTTQFQSVTPDPTGQFATSLFTSGTLPVETSWSNPYSAGTCPYNGSSSSCPSCAKPFILMISDVYTSWDSDQLPGANSNWSSNISTSDTPSVQQEITNSKINTIESVTSAFVGETAGLSSTDATYGVCTGKPASGTFDFGLVRGQCSEEPTKQGSFYMAGLAWWAHTTGVTNTAAAGNKIVNTYAVVTPSDIPNLTFPVNGTNVQLQPSFQVISYSGLTGSKGQFVDFKILATPNISCPTGDNECICTTEANPGSDSAHSCSMYSTTGGYQYAYEVAWDDSGQGNDYDLDVRWRLFVKTGSSTITVRTTGSFYAAGAIDGAGYLINGVSGAGDYIELQGAGDGVSFKTYCNGGTCPSSSSNPAGSSSGSTSSSTPGKIYVERTFKVSTSGSSSSFLHDPFWYAAKYGGFTNSDTTDPYPDSTSKWDANGDGLPDTYYYASNPLQLPQQLQNAFSDILNQSSSGTAVSVLANSAGSGANLLQAVFYPSRQFTNNTSATWTGMLQDLWYYLDPKLQNNSIREDTVKDYKLKLLDDYRLVFYYDTTMNKTRVHRYQDMGTQDINGNEIYTLVTPDPIDIEDISSLWEAGTLLWSRNIKNSARTIYYSTTDSNNNPVLGNFTTANASTLQPLLNLNPSNITTATELINYVIGYDNVCSGTATPCMQNSDCSSGILCVTMGFRSRTVTMNKVCSGTNTSCTQNSDCSSGNCLSSSVWRFGDIISSTPRVQSSIALDSYHLAPPLGYNDTTYTPFINSKDYTTRGMVYAGANDGMLHAFKLGTLDMTVFPPDQKAALCADPGGDGKCNDSDETTASYQTLGQEQWSFIPNNALPYLTYMSDPHYCHLYYVDGPTYIFDASIANGGYSGNYWDAPKQTTVNGNNNLQLNSTTWRTILIGSMGTGGACRDSSASCNAVAGVTGNQCVKTPVTGSGFSSYFALDVTSPQSPSLLWEFSDPALGYTLAGPAIVKISTKQPAPAINTPDNTKNGKWFAVFASGPTGPIDTTNHQFQGSSDQNLKLYIVDLATGKLATTTPIDTGIKNAFASSVFNAPIDVDKWNPSSNGFYQDDVFYIGYTQLSGTTWTNGGVLRVTTKQDINPANWTLSTVLSGIGPVTTSVAKLQDRTNHHLWLYFGTGRFFFKTAANLDDRDSIRMLYGVKDPCYLPNDTFDSTCTSSVGSLNNQTTNPSNSEPNNGWYITLAPTTTTTPIYGAERVITDPVAAPNGVVFFTTFMPTTDPCSLGGNSYIWALGYNTGSSSVCFANCSSSSLSAPVTKQVSNIVTGTALVQVSTGSIQEISLAGAFTQNSNRQSLPITGVPPKGQGLSIVIKPRPLKKILHIKEK